MSDFRLDRLKEERKDIRKNRPMGFMAAPLKTANGELNFSIWKCKIPGPKDSPFDGGLFSLKLEFPKNYPERAPVVFFTPPLFHPNIYTSGAVCLDLIQDKWKASITVLQLLKNLQDFLKTPNVKSPANSMAKKYYLTNRKQYDSKVKEQVKQFPYE